MLLKVSIFAILGIFATSCATVPAKGGGNLDFNSKVLVAVGKMPHGGQYDASDSAKNLLNGACKFSEGEIVVNAERATPSFCSGATYLVLLKALGAGAESLIPEIDQKDGHEHWLCR